MRMKAMKKLLTSLLFAPLLALASGAELHLDKAPVTSPPIRLRCRMVPSSSSITA
jgi:ubiquinol-cytochrome c reductase cytochrome c1 subunit